MPTRSAQYYPCTSVLPFGPEPYNTALNLLSHKGYQLFYDEITALFYAERNGWDFRAGNPVELLGTVEIYEARNLTAWTADWWRDDGACDHAAMPDRPPKEYTSVSWPRSLSTPRCRPPDMPLTKIGERHRS